jgi:hypothetical protein
VRRVLAEKFPEHLAEFILALQDMVENSYLLAKKPGGPDCYQCRSHGRESYSEQKPGLFEAAKYVLLAKQMFNLSSESERGDFGQVRVSGQDLPRSVARRCATPTKANQVRESVPGRFQSGLGISGDGPHIGTRLAKS